MDVKPLLGLMNRNREEKCFSRYRERQNWKRVLSQPLGEFGSEDGGVIGCDKDRDNEIRFLEWRKVFRRGSALGGFGLSSVLSQCHI